MKKKNYPIEFVELSNFCQRYMPSENIGDDTMHQLSVVVNKIMESDEYSLDDFNNFVDDELWKVNADYAQECKNFVSCVMFYLCDKYVREKRIRNNK